MFQGNCLVINTGVSPAGITEIKLRPETATATFKADQWFTSPAKISREILAIALSAMTTNKNVYCQLDNESTAYSEVSRFIIRND
jgi:hypothetical protein